MITGGYKVGKHCRWCGRGYYANKPIGKDGFDKRACKQAHYRAYKKYVTAKCHVAARTQVKRVTRKKRKKNTKRSKK